MHMVFETNSGCHWFRVSCGIGYMD